MKEEQKKAREDIQLSDKLLEAAGNDEDTKVNIRTMKDLKEDSPDWTDEEIIEWMNEFGLL